MAALDFQLGEVDTRVDLTVSTGASYRLQNPASDLVGLANGGSQFSVNADDGNLNYEKGFVSAPVLLTGDVEMRYCRSGAFVRFNSFYDTVNKDGTRDRKPLSDAAMDRVGRRFDGLDAYVWSNLRWGDVPVNVRIGRQVLN